MKYCEPYHRVTFKYLCTCVCRNEIYSPADVNGKVPNFKHWGWLNPAGGLLTTLEDLAQVSILSMRKIYTQFQLE